MGRVSKNNGGKQVMSFYKRPTGLYSFLSPGATDWVYKPPTNKCNEVHVATFNCKNKTVQFDCGAYRDTQTSVRCIREVIQEVLGAGYIVKVGRKAGKVMVENEYLPFDVPIKVEWLTKICGGRSNEN